MGNAKIEWHIRSCKDPALFWRQITKNACNDDHYRANCIVFQRVLISLLYNDVQAPKKLLFYPLNFIDKATFQYHFPSDLYKAKGN